MAVLRVVSPENLTADQQAADAGRVAAENQLAADSQLNNSLIAFIDEQFGIMVRHRDGASGWSDRLNEAMRVFSGKYDATKLAEIRKFGGSEVYARLIATKCRGATAMLRDIYLN